MRKTQLAVFGFGVLVMLVVVGCKDDCAICPEPEVTPLGHAQGSLILVPGASIPRMEIFGNGVIAPNLDSVKVGDSLVGWQFWTMMAGRPYTDAHWLISYYETGDTSTFMYDHGDLATIRVWGSGRSAACQLKILEPGTAAAHITIPVPYADTIAPGVADTIFWNTVEHADYYAIMIPWEVAEGGSTHWTFTYSYAIDTSFIVTGAMRPDSAMRYDVVVTPFTGPNPQTGLTNWSGPLMDGIIYSYGSYAVTSVVFSQPPPTVNTALSVPTEARPEYNAEEIVANVYKQLRK